MSLICKNNIFPNATYSFMLFGVILVRCENRGLTVDFGICVRTSRISSAELFVMINLLT